jgi:hypothetical protein
MLIRIGGFWPAEPEVFTQLNRKKPRSNRRNNEPNPPPDSSSQAPRPENPPTLLALGDVPEDILDFMLRWRRKSTLYDYNQVEDCFDGFFTAFVLYNFLYDPICEYDPVDYPQRGDRQRATEVVLSFLGSEAIATNAELRRGADSIRQLVENGTFYLRGEQWDAQRVSGLTSPDSYTWAAALLQILYQIRCNTFHGRKQFRPVQKRILVPSIKALETINDMLMHKIAGNRVRNGQLADMDDAA